MKIIICSLLMGLVAPTLFAAPEREKPTVIERGPHHRVWQSIHWQTNDLGKVVAKTNSYTELETGMHYQQDGKWVESEATIEITPTGASASKGAHTVNFAANINTVGAIDLTTPDGKKMRSHVLGLSYFDTVTGRSALIAEIKDSIGVLTPPNRVIYPDAFTDLKADIRYTYSKRGFEQDIILREEIPSPSEYGLNPESTRLEVLTEFVEAPAPIAQRRMVKDGAADQKLRFGSMAIGPGIAFLTGNGNAPTNNVPPGSKSGVHVPVAKKWDRMDGRNFLIESVKYDWAKASLETLPKPEAKAGRAERVAKMNKATEKRQLPVRREAKSSTAKLRVASLAPEQQGFLIDYSVVSGGTDFTFQGDTTYLVSGTVSLYGTITLEGGTVIKFDSSDWSEIYAEDGIFDCKTDSYRPAIFTDMNDNSVGEMISGSCGVPAYWGGMAIISGNPILSNVRFSYGSWPLSLRESDITAVLTDVQYVNCAIPINIEGGSATLRNVLMTGSLIPLRGNDAYTVFAENVTIDGADPQLSGPGGDFISFTNSIVVAVTNLGDASIITNNSVINTNSIPGIFQTVGAASYYLADESVYRDVGTTNINANLLDGLRRKTTYPPIVISNITYTNDLDLFPQAQRDYDIPDLGYHYDPLDYVMAEVVMHNAVLTILPGTAVGTFSSYAIDVGTPYAGLICVGEPHHLNYIVAYNLVQEQSNPSWITGVESFVILASWGAPSSGPEVSFRFTVLAQILYGAIQFYGYSGYDNSFSFRDCQIYGGIIDCAGPTFYFTNNLFHRINFNLEENYHGNSVIQNNTFYGGGFGSDNPNIALYNNLFAETSIGFCCDVTNDFNAFYNTTGTLSPAGASNVVVTNLTFEAGPLGGFYLATNNIKLLNTGSTNANLLTLYHFTTATNQVKETNSMVDIGFHYVAVGTNGLPVDTDDDGDPDYHEDENGNGVIESGETSPTDPVDLGLRVLITQPKSGSIIP